MAGFGESHSDINFFSGMPLPRSRQREIFRLETNAAHNLRALRINRLADYVTKRITCGEGVELLESDVFPANEKYRCEHYVFGVIMGELWAQPGTDVPWELVYETSDFLSGHNYSPVDTPQSGDVVAYSEEGAIKHFGLMHYDNRRVHSKQGVGPILLHPLELVRNDYGDIVHFFRKEYTQAI